MKFFCLIDVFDVCLNCCYRLRILIFASKYQNECDGRVSVATCFIFLMMLKQNFFMLFVKVHYQHQVRNYICRME